MLSRGGTGGGSAMTGRTKENYNRNYINYVNAFDPPTQHFKTCFRAFLVGGFICSIGQFFRYMLEFAGLEGDELAGTVSVILIFLGTFLTGLGVYDRIGICQFGCLSRHRIQDRGVRLWHGREDVRRCGADHRLWRERGGGGRAFVLAHRAVNV